MNLEEFYKKYEQDIDRYVEFCTNTDKRISFSDLKSAVDEKLVKSFVGYKDEGTPKAWLRKLVRSEFINQYRRNKREKTFFYDQNEDFDIDHSPYGASFDQEYALIGLSEVIDEYVATCSNVKRVVFEERMANVKFWEIADSHNINEATARGTMMRIKEEIVVLMVNKLPKEEVQEFAAAIPGIKTIIMRNSDLERRVYS